MGASLLGIQPDILGELAVLDALRDQEEVSRQLAFDGLRLAWRFDQLRYSAFAERVARDHPGHPGLADILDVDPETEAERDTWFALAPQLVPYLGSSTNPSLQRIASLLEMQATDAEERSQRAINAMLFHVGNLLLAEGQVHDAIEMYADVIEAAHPAWESYASSLTNRGVAHLRLDRIDDAEADFTSVIESALASDESKACCLNNRADLRSDAGDVAGSVEDRTAVLQLADTTYNRRYIALARRARSLWAIGDRDAAFADLQAVLDEPDIVIEQKLNARLVRAEWRAESGQVDLAIDDLQRVIEGRRNFAGVSERATSLLDRLSAL
jgi:tetratricopeptide (TPR) repeat protein